MAGNFTRKVIRIRATDSPNVRRGLLQVAAGQEPDDKIIIPGVLSWSEYQKRLQSWDERRRCVGLEAQFYVGAEVLLYPPLWLDAAAAMADRLQGRQRRARAIGVDPAEGGDSTAIAVVDEYGLIDLQSLKTPDTTAVPRLVLAAMRQYGVPASKVWFDRGGGGKQHADRLREQGHQVNTVAFGESLRFEPQRGINRLADRREMRESQSAYVNRRAEMYGRLRQLMNPDGQEWRDLGQRTILMPHERGGFAIPRRFEELRRQLAPMPLLYDAEGRLKMLPKNRPGTQKVDDDGELVRGTRTLVELLGRSPDEADALVVAVHAMTAKAPIKLGSAL